jgi:hypothetical protein
MCRKRFPLLAISLSFALMKIVWFKATAAAVVIASAAVHLHASHETTGRHMMLNEGRWGKGIKFDFSGEAGGGKGFLRRMQRRNPTKLDRILQRTSSHKTKTIDEIGWLLDKDRDLVGSLCMHPCDCLAAAALLICCLAYTIR